MATKNDTNEMTIDRVDVEMPSKYNVIFWNDDHTPLDFVVQILVNVFSYTVENALKFCLTVEQDGKGIAGTYIKSIADAKATLVREVCVKANYDLKVTVEKS